MAMFIIIMFVIYIYMRLNVESVRFKVGAVYIFRLLYTMGHKYRASGRPGD